MTAQLSDSAPEIGRQGRDSQLLAPFREAEKRPEDFRIGLEIERFGISGGRPLLYEGSGGIEAILQRLATRGDGEPLREFPGGPVIGLRCRHGSITLEPGGQMEFSGAPERTLHEVAGGLAKHEVLVRAGSLPGARVAWLGLGFHPFARREEFGWVPKLRYAVMRRYLPTRGEHGLDMMLRTATVQANFDYSGERDAMDKLSLALRLAPLTTALFANSPFMENRRAGGLTIRGRVWLDVDADRCGIVRPVWKERPTYRDYVEWALDSPMFFIQREGRVVDNAGQTFRQFLDAGFRGERAQTADWERHLNTLFPEVRLKRTLEIRGADSQSDGLAMALPALWTGLLYDRRAFAAAHNLCGDWTFDEVTSLRTRVWRDGLRAQFRGEPVLPIAEALMDIAAGGLERRNQRDAADSDERVHLRPLMTLVEHGRTPAEELLATLDRAADWRKALLGGDETVDV